MKKILFLIFIFLSLLGCSTKEKKDDCNILPSGTSYKIVLNDELYILTEHGLIEKGCFFDFEKWRGWMEWPVLNSSQKTIYFVTSFLLRDPGIIEGVYKIDLTKPTLKPIFIVKSEDERTPKKPTISLDGEFLTFCLIGHSRHNFDDIMLLNLKTKKLQKVVDDAYGLFRPVWINNYQFIYYSYSGKLFLFDVNTMQRTDLKLNGYAPGAVTPDGKHILLSGNHKTVLYNINTRTIDEIIMDKTIEINGMFWLPDRRGFIYHTMSFEEIYTLLPDSVGGVSYYSLDKKKSVRLVGKMALTGGFVVPLDIELNPVDNAHNRRILSLPNEINKICEK